MSDFKIDNNQGRIYELDAIRGLAAIGVLVCHLPRGFWFGATGVDLFFVLSGFLITGIILRSLDHPRFLATFYLRRSLRIFPIYYLAIFFVVVLNFIRQHPSDMSGLPFYLVYLQHIHSYWGAETPSVDSSLGHTWTLAIEEQFYLIWPVALFFLRRFAALWLSILFIILPMVLRHLGFERNILLGHTDGLALGALLAYIFFYVPQTSQRKMSKFFFLAGGLAFVLYWLLWIKLSSYGYTGKAYMEHNAAISLISIAYFGLVGVIVCFSGSRWLQILRNKWLIKIGTISYGLYLYHWILYELLDTFFVFRWGFNNPYWLDVIKITATFSMALASWHWIEKPILKLKDRFNY